MPTLMLCPNARTSKGYFALDDLANKLSTPASLGNFRDLRGLLLRMLRSGDRSAYAALFREGLGKLATPLDLMLTPWERRRIATARPSDLPLILIVGSPRAGTTLVSQVLSRYLDVSTINNLSALFPRAPITAARCFAWMLADRAPRFTSFYGQTLRLADPNEGFHIWNRWLGSDRYRAARSLDSASQIEMVRFFDAWLTAAGKPLLSKHIRNTDAVTTLAETLPNSYFIGVTRKPRMVVQSLIRARQQIQGSKDLDWGLYSRADAANGDPLGYVDDVCHQVIETRNQLRLAKVQVGTDRFHEIDYDAFCRDPCQAVDGVSSFVPKTRVHRQRLNDELRPFQPSNQSHLTADEMGRMERVLQAIDLTETTEPVS
jgi:hypothetical protein